MTKCYDTILFKGWFLEMSEKQNCWEFNNCNRGPKEDGGDGTCRASFSTEYDGMNGGKNGGRACWEAAGTMCKKHISATLAKKRTSCRSCDFRIQVQKEERGSFKPTLEKHKEFSHEENQCAVRL